MVYRKKKTKFRPSVGTVGTSKFKAPTPGLEHACFTYGSPKDAANSRETVLLLSNYVGTRTWPHSTVAANAMREMEAPTFDAWDKIPPRKYWSGTEGTSPYVFERVTMKGGDLEKNRINCPVDDEITYQCIIDLFMRQSKQTLRLEEAYEENSAKVYNLLIQHCPPGMLAELAIQPAWSAASRAQDMISLLEMIRDVTHNMKQSTQGVMGMVQCHANTMTHAQAKGDDLEAFAKVTVALHDTERAHGGVPGYHPVLYAQHYALLWDKDAKATADAMGDDEQLVYLQGLKDQAMASSCEEYNACHFILMADPVKYKAAKKHLHNAYVSGTDIYPKNIVAAKRWLSDFKSTEDNPGKTPPIATTGDDDEGVAFAEAEKNPVKCFGCGKEGHRLQECKSIKDADKAAIYEASIKDWTRADGSPYKNPASKKGVVNVEASTEEAAVAVPDDITEGKFMNYIATKLGFAGVSVRDQGHEVYDFDDIQGHEDYDHDDMDQAGKFGFCQVGDPYIKVEEGAEPYRGVSFAGVENADNRDGWRSQGIKGSKPKKNTTRVPYKPTWAKEAVAKEKNRTTLDENKLYLDSCATYHTMFLTKYLTNVKDGNSVMHGQCNAGETSTSIQGMYGRFRFWVNKNGIANLLSIPMLEKAGYVVTTHTKKDWKVISPEGEEIVFARDTGLCEGMPFIDLREQSRGWALIETVRNNYDKFTQKEIEKATLARKVQARIGNPPDGRYKQIVSAGDRALKHCPVSVKDIANAHVIFGPNLNRLKGAAIRQPVRHTKKMGERLKIPREFYRQHKYVTLSADVMFVCGLPFLVTYSRDIKLTTAEFVTGRTARKLANSLMKIVKLYLIVCTRWFCCQASAYGHGIR